MDELAWRKMVERLAMMWGVEISGVWQATGGRRSLRGVG